MKNTGPLLEMQIVGIIMAHKGMSKTIQTKEAEKSKMRLIKRQ
jgi:hypothetical protein